MRQEITDNLDVLLAVLPQRVSQQVQEIGRTGQLLEVILDLGRVPTARYLDGDVVLSESEVSSEDIHGVVKRVGAFDEDNLAKLSNTNECSKCDLTGADLRGANLSKTKSHDHTWFARSGHKRLQEPSLSHSRLRLGCW